MGFNLTKQLTCNGTNNLLTLLKNAGYDGPARLGIGGSLVNLDAAVDAYLHFTDSNLYLPGIRQVESLAFAGSITADGNAVLTITASGLTGSPLAVNVPLTAGMTNRAKAVAAVHALAGSVPFSEFADPAFNDATLSATKKVIAANDATFDIVLTDPNGTGVTPVAHSTNTTAGSLATTSGVPFGPTSPSTVWNLEKGTDLSTVWIYTASSITVTSEVQG